MLTLLSRVAYVLGVVIEKVAYVLGAVEEKERMCWGLLKQSSVCVGGCCSGQGDSNIVFIPSGVWIGVC